MNETLNQCKDCGHSSPPRSWLREGSNKYFCTEVTEGTPESYFHTLANKWVVRCRCEHCECKDLGPGQGH
ncbi:hypothetical protein SEA_PHRAPPUCCINO_86 [Mycobacterium phage Phrappuccino]|uniref:Uncharacterized protein n=1 Tax=Mycobacterium phage Phrappuccino TaxID=2591223 RepID=A0A514DDR6_9CAUD|nr:hypothetical protein KHQ87_gp086 [Mycobacterium phage Phrappuccino]QDH91761.1 hypothetical protein SEA_PHRAPPUCCINO_86 [Mycobacterium phage Phrappuccino]QIQ63203.1 hypothetical protein SEA_SETTECANDELA_86 [Mycobacterium phage Settecandela]